MSSHGFLLRRVWHLAIPTPPAMGSSPTEYAEFTEPPAEMSSHGFHRFTQILRVRFVPTEFTESTEFGSVGMAGMPYPPTSVRIRVICGRLFSARSFCAFRAFCGNLFPPMDFSLGGYGRDAIPSYICAHPCHLWEALLCQKFLCVPCVLWESLSSHGFLLRRVWHLAIPTPPAMGYYPTEYAEFTEPPAEKSLPRISQIYTDA